MQLVLVVFIYWIVIYPAVSAIHRLNNWNLGPVARSLVSAIRWLRGIKTYRFPWHLMLVSANRASSNPGQVSSSSLDVGPLSLLVILVPRATRFYHRVFETVGA